MREHQLKGEFPATLKFFFLYPRHSVVIRSIRDKQYVCVDILMKEIELEMIDIIFTLF